MHVDIILACETSTNGRGACILSELLYDRSFERDALDFFPTPLADTLDEAIVEVSARAQRDKIVETFRVAIRLFGLLGLAGIQNLPPSTSQLGEQLKKLLRQGLTDGEWIALTREIVRPFASMPEQFPVPALVTAFFFNNGKPTPLFDVQGSCSKLMAMRKSDTVAHGVTGTEESAADILAARVPDFEVFLKAMDWLWRVSLVVPISLHSRTDGTAEYSALKLSGVTPRRGFRPEIFRSSIELTLARVYAQPEDLAPIELYPFLQYAEAAPGQSEVYLFDECNKHDVLLRTFPTGLLRSDPDALLWLRSKFSTNSSTHIESPAVPRVDWTLNGLREIAYKASNDYLEKMQRERVYLTHLYTRRTDLEMGLSGFLDRKCNRSGLLIVGTSGIGKTNTLCHVVSQWRESIEKLGQDVVLFLGGSTLPGGSFNLRDVVLDRLESTDSFTSFLSAFGAQAEKTHVQLVIIVDSVDKHPQPAELLRQLDDLITRNAHLPWFKVVVSIGEVTYGAIRKGGFTPAARTYYTTAARAGAMDHEATEILLGPMTDEELADAYEKYHGEPGMSPTSSFGSLTEEVKNAIRNPLFLRVVMEVFDGRRVARRVLTAEVLLEYCNKKVFSDPNRMFFVNRFVDLLLSKQWTMASFDALAQVAELRQAVLDPSPNSPYLQLLDEQVLEEQFKRSSPVLPPQRTVAFTYDRLLEYLLLNRIVEQYGLEAEAIIDLSHRAQTYLPLRGALATLLLSQVDEGNYDSVAELLRAGNANVMKAIGVRILTDLEQIEPATVDTTDARLTSGPVGALVTALCATTDWSVSLLLDAADELKKTAHYRRAGFIYERLISCVDEASNAPAAAHLRQGAGDVLSFFGQKRGALEEYGKALGYYQAAADINGESAMYDAIGKVHMDLGELDLAREFFEKSLQMDHEAVASAQPGADQAKAGSLMNLSDYWHRAGNISHAISLAREAEQLYRQREVDYQRNIASATNQVGLLSRRQGAMETARLAHQLALTTYQQLGDKGGIAESLCMLAQAYQGQGKWTEALAYNEAALNLCQEIGDQQGIARVWNVLGETQRWTGDFDAALHSYEQALQIFQRIEAKYGIAMCQTNLGSTYFLQGNAKRAYQILSEVHTAWQDILGNEGSPECLAFLSSAAWQLGRLDEAVTFSDSAIRILQEQNFSEEEIQLSYFYRYELLLSLDRAEEATAVLRIAFANVMEQVSNIKDKVSREGFIKNYPLRHNIMSAAVARGLITSEVAEAMT